MKAALKRLASAGALALACIALPAQAGRTCEVTPPSAHEVIRGLELADKVRASLDASGAEVVVLARAGQDLSKYGLRYSHLGFAYREPRPGGGGAWRVVHKLNECGTASSSLYRQGLGDFFLDHPWRYEAAWMPLAPGVQDAVLPWLTDDARALRMQHAAYSVVSYAWGTRYQQSNQWAIETLAAALRHGEGFGRLESQAWLRENGYRPSTLTIDALTRLGGRLTAANVAFDDHPPELRFTDRIQTVTVDSVFDWLARAGMAGPVTTVSLGGP